MLTLRNVSKIFSRSYSIRIGKAVKFPEEITQLLSTPTWDVKELMKVDDTDRTSLVDKAQVEKLLKLSGLEVTSEDEIDEIISNLKEQVKFIDQLHSIEVTTTVASPISKRLSLSDIHQQISSQQPDATKGETPNSWDPMSVTKESKYGNYIVKEGLIKEKH